MARLSAAICSVAVLALILPWADALFGLDGSGGTFRYGHVHYRTVGENVVEFTIEAAFTRKVDTSYFYGTALDGFAQLGDKITMTGRETPEFDFGDNKVLSKLTMDVMSYSARENFVMGKVVVRHKYDTPNNAGNPWLARFTGCCRSSELLNNGDNPWELIAQVDLSQASASPRVSVLPVVSVPREPDLESSQRLPKVTIPATITVSGEDPPKTAAMHWTKDNPFDVGNAASFQNGFTSLSLEPFFKKDALKCCTNRAATECAEWVKDNPSVSPGCLARLLTTDYQLRPGQAVTDAETVSPAFTVEGWVRIDSPQGGVVMSTGKAAGRETCHSKGSCQVALIYIHVNATHVTVGHEHALDDAGTNWELNTVEFAVSSNAALVAQLADEGFYLNSNGNPTLENKFVHVTVVRKSLVGPSHYNSEKHEQEFWFSTYKVYINGFMLEVASFPFCAAGAVCTNGLRYGGFASEEIVTTRGCYKADFSVTDASSDDGCKVELTIGESNPLPGPRRATNRATAAVVPGNDVSGRCALLLAQGLCNDDFGNETALLFGAYRGAAHAESYFSGLLDEWRIWNGERSRADILNAYRRPLVPVMSNNYGDPTIVTDANGKGKMIGGSNYQTMTALIALYSFDWSMATAKDTDNCPAKVAGCLYSTITPTFPLKPTATADMITWTATWTAYVGTGNVDAAPSFVKHDLTDSSGVMFYKGGSLYQVMDKSKGVVTFQSRPPPGKYQVTVQVAAREGGPSVPVDFIVDIVDSIYDPTQVAYTLIDKAKFPFNQYIPSLSFEAPVEALPGDDSTVEFVDEDQLKDQLVECSSDPNPTQVQKDACAAKYDEKVGIYDGYSYPKKARVYAGFGFEATIVGNDYEGVISLNTDETADQKIARYRDSKVGFSIGPAPDSARFTSVKDTNPGEMVMSWTPCAAELGATIVCMDAVDYHIQRSPGKNPSEDKVSIPASSNMRCLNFDVVEDPVPRFDKDIPTTLTLTIGREGKIELRAWDDNCLDSVHIDVAANSTMPPGAVLNALAAVSTGFVDQTRRSCTSVVRTMRWTPSMKMGGFEGQTCFTARDTGGSLSCGAEAVAHTSLHCVKFKVQRCKYALQKDQQLQEISALFGVDWMRLWSLNQNIMHPDYVVYTEQVVSVGHLYKVAPNERMDRVSQRLGMSVQQMRDLNYDIASNDALLQPGQELCVVPNSCKGLKDTFYTGMVYKDDKFYAASDWPVVAPSETGK